MTVLLQFVFGDLPPFLPVIGDDVGHEHLLNLLECGFAAETLEHEFDEVQMVQSRHLPQRLDVRGLARQDVIARNRLERFRRKAQVHRMSRLVLEIDGQPRKDRVNRFDFTESPASVHAIAALHQLQQRLHVRAADLAGSHQFLKLFFHNASKN